MKFWRSNAKRIRSGLKRRRAAALKYHPDKNSSENATEMFRRVREAFEILSDPESRRVFDEKRRRRMKKRKPSTRRLSSICSEKRRRRRRKRKMMRMWILSSFVNRARVEKEQQHQARQKRRKK